MLKKIVAGMLAVSMLALSGCASVQKGEEFAGLGLSDTPGTSPVAHYNAKNWGIYLLTIPLITGDTTRPNTLFGISLLSDEVDVDSVGAMLATAAARDGASSIEDLTSSRFGALVFLPIPLFYRSVAMSANGVQ